MKYKLKCWYPGLPKEWKVGQELIKYKAYSNIPNYIPEECIPIAFNIKGVSEYEVENNPEFWEKVEEKTPIFISEDGVEMFEGMAYWYIDRHYRLFDVSEVCKSTQLRTDIIRFSTKEAAEEYIDENKLAFSKKDIINFVCNILPYPKEYWANVLELYLITKEE